MAEAEELLPHTVDRLASSRPDELYARIPKSFTSYVDGYRSVSWSQLANAVDGIAWLLTEQLGQSDTFETLVYFGPNDIGYMVVILGAAKAGYSVLLPSPMLNFTSHASLLETAKCKTILTLAPPYAPAVNHLLDNLASDLRIIHIPTLFELLDTSYRHYPYEKTYETLQDRPLVMVHTSGTTGFPKPLVYTHRTSNSFFRELQEPPPLGFYNVLGMIQTRRVLTAFPFFHAGAVMVALFIAIYSRCTLIIPLAGVALSASSIVDALEQNEVDSLCLPAPFVEQIAKNPTWFAAVVKSRAKEIGYSGADISDATGAAFLTAGFRLANFFGSSETLTTHTIALLDGGPADAWHYMQPHPYVNASFEPHGGSDDDQELFELILHRNPEPTRTQPAFTIFPDRKIYATRDLFSPHPQDPQLWRFRGRADDMITAASGEMTNPLALEQRIASLPAVAAALVVGDGRWRKALLIEPAAIVQDVVSWIDEIWPAIAEANSLLSRTSQIARAHVLLTTPERPMQRTSKGTIQRGPTLKLYGAEIDDLYRRLGDGVDLSQAPYPVHLSMSSDKTSGQQIV